MYACHVNDYEWYNHMFILTPQVVYAAARMVIPVPQENQRLTTYDLRVTTVRWNRNRADVDTVLHLHTYIEPCCIIYWQSAAQKKLERFYNV